MYSFLTRNVLYEVTYTGLTIKDALEHAIIPDEGTNNFPNYLHVSGERG